MDTGSLIQRVIQRALVSAAGDKDSEASLAPDEAASEDMLVNVLGDRLGQMLAGSASERSDEEELRAADGGAEEFELYDHLLDKLSALAAALGACDCWGDDLDCDVCHGVGRPGWLPPDKRLFARYVRPAIQALKSANGVPAGARFKPEQPYKESEDGRHTW